MNTARHSRRCCSAATADVLHLQFNVKREQELLKLQHRNGFPDVKAQSHWYTLFPCE
eukprot:SAG31_NODE_2789_length_5089_cov_4.516433_2_plen_57_part_00